MVRYKAADGTWKRAAAARSANGRIRPGYAVLNGTPTQVKSFQYQVRYYDDREVKYKSDKTDATNAGKAETLRRKIEQQSTAAAGAEKAGLTVISRRAGVP